MNATSPSSTGGVGGGIRAGGRRLLLVAGLLLGLAGLPASARGGVIQVAKVHDDPNGNGELYRGQTLQYTVTIANRDATDVVVDLRDMIPAGVGFVSVDDDGGGTVMTTTPVLQIGGIPVASSSSTQVRFTVLEDGTEPIGADICNVAEVDCPPGPPVLSMPACIRLAAPPVALSVEKRHDDPNGDSTLLPGQTLEYTVTFTNGSAAATTVTLTDPIPLGVAFAAVIDDGGGTVVVTTPTLRIADIPVPASSSVDVVFTVTEDGSRIPGEDVCNVATMESPMLPSPIQSAPSCITVGEPPAVAFVSKWHDDPNGNGTLSRGQTLTYTVRLDNTSAAGITDASVTDPIPAGSAFGAVIDDGGGTVGGTSPVLQIDGIPIPAMGFTDVIFTVVEDGSLMAGTDTCNVATFDTAANPTAVDSAPACIQVVDQMTLVLVSKSHDDPNGNGLIDRGQTLRYTVRIDNGGPSNVTDATLVDPIPEGVEFVSVVDDGGGTVITTSPVLELSDIPVMSGGFTEVIFEVMEDATQRDGTDICNSATMDTSENPGPVTSAEACITVNAPCDPLFLRPRTLLVGAKDPGAGADAATFQWEPEAEALEYHLNSVSDKVNLTSPGPLQSGGGIVECAATLPTCSDPDALDPAQPPRLFYQAISACGPDAADEGPI